MLAIKIPPLPIAKLSLIRPPMPVLAPWNGAIAVGKLCVSAVKAIWYLWLFKI